MKKVINGYTTMTKELRKYDDVKCIAANEETLAYISTVKPETEFNEEEFGYTATFVGIPVYQDDKLRDDEFSIEIEETLQDKLNNQRYSELKSELIFLLEKEKSLRLGIEMFKVDNEFQKCVDLNKELVETRNKIRNTKKSLRRYLNILNK